MDLMVGIIVFPIQICVIALIAAIIPWIYYAIFKNRKKAKIIFALCFAIEIFVLIYLMYNPIYVCPEEYKEFVSEKDEQSITKGGLPIYNDLIPTTRICVEVNYADENEIVFTTYFFIAGTRKIVKSDDGLSPYYN